MKSPLKRVIVYDLETGGFDWKRNSITEIALVAVDLETLEVVDKWSTLIQPYFLFSFIIEDGLKELKAIFKSSAGINPDNHTKSLKIGKEWVTLKDLKNYAGQIEDFHSWVLPKYGEIMDFPKINEAIKEGFSSEVKLYFDMTYNPQALEATSITGKMLMKEGIDISDAIIGTTEFFTRNTIGNAKPILAGHNIVRFDNPFLENFFKMGFLNLQDYINKELYIDTLQWARMKWPELANYQLGNCANEVGLTLVDAHRAINDTETNAEFLIEMLKSLRGEGTQVSSYQRRKIDVKF